MNRTYVFLVMLLSLSYSPPTAIGEQSGGFAEVLSLADLDPNQWPSVLAYDSGGHPSLGKSTWQLCQQLLFRLRQFPSEQLKDWATEQDFKPVRGNLVAVRGKISSVTELAHSQESPDAADSLQLYLCKYEDDADDGQGYVLVPQIPSQWDDSTNLGENVQFVGLVLQTATDNSTELLLTNRLEWYPVEGVPTGLLLLSQQGMDVALLDEVRHRQPFVKTNVSREGDAFYACLTALANVETHKLSELTLQNLNHVAGHWKNDAARNKEKLETLREQLRDSSQDTSRRELEEKVINMQRKLAIAAAVKKQALRQVSSVAPLFMQPDKETGQLVRIEGLARRAVRIAADKLDMDHYFELEVFTSDSQNLPVVCCTTSLPDGFPTGDEIRENVRIDGIFFKSWRYRTRKNTEPDGQTARQQQLYTPVVIGGEPIWLTTSSQHSPAWAIVGGLGILLAFGAFWMQVMRLSRRARRDEYSLDPSKLEQHLKGESTQTLS